MRGRVPYVVFTHGMLDPYFKRAFPMKHLKKWAYWLPVEYWVHPILRDGALQGFGNIATSIATARAASTSSS